MRVQSAAAAAWSPASSMFTTATEAGTGVTVYLITATACNQPTAIVPSQCPNTFNPRSSYIERRVSASL